MLNRKILYIGVRHTKVELNLKNSICYLDVECWCHNNSVAKRFKAVLKLNLYLNLKTNFFCI